MSDQIPTPEPASPDAPSTFGGRRPSSGSVRRPRSSMIGLLAMSAMLGGGFAGAFGGGRSSYTERHDEERPKTKHDLERIEEARLRRERRAAKKRAQNETSAGTAPEGEAGER